MKTLWDKILKFGLVLVPSKCQPNVSVLFDTSGDMVQSDWLRKEYTIRPPIPIFSIVQSVLIDWAERTHWSKEIASYRSWHASQHVYHARAVMHAEIANPRWRGQVSFKKEVVVRVNDLVFWLTMWFNFENVLLTFKWYVFVWQKCSMLTKYANGHFFNKWNCVSMP